MASSRFRQAKSADEEAKNNWPYGIFKQWQKQIVKRVSGRFANEWFR